MSLPQLVLYDRRSCPSILWHKLNDFDPLLSFTLFHFLFSSSFSNLWERSFPFFIQTAVGDSLAAIIVCNYASDDDDDGDDCNNDDVDND